MGAPEALARLIRCCVVRSAAGFLAALFVCGAVP
jgi:hypothetical protein